MDNLILRWAKAVDERSQHHIQESQLCITAGEIVVPLSCRTCSSFLSRHRAPMKGELGEVKCHLYERISRQDVEFCSIYCQVRSLWNSPTRPNYNFIVTQNQSWIFSAYSSNSNDVTTRNYLSKISLRISIIFCTSSTVL